MKKRSITFSLAIFLFAMLVFGSTQLLFASNGQSGRIINVTAGANVNRAYHQISYIAIEYSDPVVAPGLNGFSVVDYATAKMKETYDRRPFNDLQGFG